MSTPDFFPVGSRVVLKGLVKAKDLNGKVGVVKSGLFNGRQHVAVDETNKSVALKVSNLSWEGRSVESLSVKELKAVLKCQKGVTDGQITGLDKSELLTKVQNLNASPESLAHWVAEGSKEEAAAAAAAAKSPAAQSPSAAAMSADPAQAASQLSQMNPEQLKQQARMLRSMPPDQIRRMNPQMANFSNAQIQAAASQMEMMASNPAMMKMAAEQMKNMSPEELQQAQQQARSGNVGGQPPMPVAPTNGSGGGSMPAPSADQASQAAQMMQNMTPEQLRQQADMFGSMPPDQVRRMNPQLAHMSDDQIKMAATQFRMMADNPAMMKMAADQMKNMTPEQIKNIREGKVDPTMDPSQAMAGGGDPSQMLANMDKTQLKSMLKTMKENPDMMKQFAASSGISEEQLGQGVEMFANMDDSKLDMAVNMMQKAQKAKDTWSSVDAKTGGHLKKILMLLFVVIVGLLVQRIFFSSGASVPSVASVDEIPNIMTKETAPVTEDEFETEF